MFKVKTYQGNWKMIFIILRNFFKNFFIIQVFKRQKCKKYITINLDKIYLELTENKLGKEVSS